MDNMLSRTKSLIGSEACEKLAKSKIIVFGLGGVGGYTVEALARAGVEEIDIVDNDDINVTNINRQIYALQSTIGMSKVNVAHQRITDINPNIKSTCYKTFFSKENSNNFDFSKYDYIIDAIDTISSKIELILKAKQAKIPIISCLGTGNKLNPELFEISDIYKTSVCPLARKLRTELKKEGIKSLKVLYSKELPKKTKGQKIPASISFVPPVAGLLIAGAVIKDLINKKVDLFLLFCFCFYSSSSAGPLEALGLRATTSSIRRMLIAASVANLRILARLMAGSRTPAL